MTAYPSSKSIVGARKAPFHVVIIGGGIGGLTLAQGLKKSGVSVAVYERDRTRTDREQGYRVHINPVGSLALYECLPPALFALFVRTCGTPSAGIRFFTEQMKVLLASDLRGRPEIVGDGIAQHRSVSRITLRQVLLSELDEVVHFGKTFVRYDELPSGHIRAQFADGSSAEGDVLVAADGVGSRVRRQLLPGAEPIETGVVGIGGKVFLDAESRRQIAPLLLEGLSLVSGNGLALFIALQELGGAEAIGNDESAAFGAHFDNTRSYLMWALGGRRPTLKFDGEIRSTDGATLRATALKAIAHWDDRFKALVRLADESTINAIAIRTSQPVAPWRTGRVTLLGDAIHAMTPYRGIGANVALKDAVRLYRALTAAGRGECELIGAVHAYEAEMLDYGFRAVRSSLRAMEQAVQENPLRILLSRTAFRLVDRLAPCKTWMFRSMGDEKHRGR
jgi:2-polyprenyl-6-methoxyphenol hydroxylase-like FAD-dependent oxidoreductase